MLMRTVAGVASFPVKVVRHPIQTWLELFERLLYQAILHVMWGIYRLVFELQKVEISSETGEIEADSLRGVPRIYVSWHARQLGALPLLLETGELVAVSMPHEGWGDEGLFQRCLRRAFFANMRRRGFHFVELRRGRAPGQAVREIVEKVRAGKPVLMTADSARKGAFIAQLGAVQAASAAGVEVVPFSFAGSRKIRINPFWDNHMVPVPFGTSYVRLGRPIRLEGTLDEEGLEQARQQLAESLNRLTHEVDDMAGIRREYRLLPAGTPVDAGARR